MLSVVIPAHNEEKTICKTIDSVLWQDIDQIEIIVVDDGSTDLTSFTIIKRYGLKRMWLRHSYRNHECKDIESIWGVHQSGIFLLLIKKENGGKSDALNVGLKFSHGEYVACIDADSVLSIDTLKNLLFAAESAGGAVAVGGKILPTQGFSNYILQKRVCFAYMLQGFQELEYGIEFNIVRPILSKMGTTMLISGALGIFKREEVIKIGGYALDTVGEDFEIVMRLRQVSAKEHTKAQVYYSESAACTTELPWKLEDWAKQRIRWTIGLTDVLWKYKEVALGKDYCIAEKITFWYYILIEKLSPFLEFASLIVCILCGASNILWILIFATVIFQSAMSIAGSIKTIRMVLKKASNKLKAIVKFVCLLLSFITVYHIAHSFVRVISGLVRIKKKRSKNNKCNVWKSPERM